MKRKSKYTLEILSEAVIKSITFSDVLHHLGLKKTGGNYQNIQTKIRNFNIDTSHFKGKLWAKGLTAFTSERIKKGRDARTFTDEEVLCKNSPMTKSYRLKNLMIKYGQKYICENGHEPIWMNEPLTLHIDHIDKDRTNNSLKNLRFLCPNCHQQTDTWGNNSKKVSQ